MKPCQDRRKRLKPREENLTAQRGGPCRRAIWEEQRNFTANKGIDLSDLQSIAMKLQEIEKIYTYVYIVLVNKYMNEVVNWMYHEYPWIFMAFKTVLILATRNWMENVRMWSSPVNMVASGRFKLQAVKRYNIRRTNTLLHCFCNGHLTESKLGKRNRHDQRIWQARFSQCEDLKVVLKSYTSYTCSGILFFEVSSTSSMLSTRKLQPGLYCRAKDAAKAQEVFDQLRAQSIRQINFKIWLWPTPRFKARHMKTRC